MEWPEFCESPSDHYLLDSLPPQLEVEHREWTYEENKLFENALAEFDPSSPAFFENVASRVPRKSIEDVIKHYEALVEDIEMIESDRCPLPNYETDDGMKTTNEMRGSSSQAKRANPSQPRRRGLPWTEEEHQLFLMGLNKYGKGDWRSISRFYVKTRTPTQVASHAQKYFKRQNSSTPVDKRRPSINDIQAVHSSPFSGSLLYSQMAPMFNLSYHGGHHELTGDRFANASPVLPAMSSAFPVASPIISQVPSASFLLPPSINQQWGWFNGKDDEGNSR
ncbi:hypothetical protein RJ639_008537 [Escallonia herrerae]|uniref:Uncharacterized protein n=1 Tax=Escallonia herrerae TaxID=1293975 RepID=A0AA89AW30_9ASTE|nr:hypothetical protein RJ639_008537 [Escallonia herrerae]